MTNKGQYVATPGSTLDTGDYVCDRGVWYRLETLEDSTRFSRRFLGIAKDSTRRRILLDSTNVKAYRLHR